jgi:hypothetical protein
MIIVIFHTIVHLKKQLPWQWLHTYNKVRMFQCIQTTRTSLQDWMEDYILWFKLK